MAQPPVFRDGHGATWAPLPLAETDRRWLDVQDVRNVVLRYKPPVTAKVDKWVNYAIEYRADEGDHWQDPATTLATRKGDCEDIALLKRAIILRTLPEDHVFFVIMKDLVGRQDHAVLFVQEGGIWRLLDAFNSLSLPLAEMKDYRPIMAFNRRDAWLYGRKR